jgi:hypothetical protein
MKIDLWNGHPEPDFAKGDRIMVFFNDSKGIYEGTFRDGKDTFFGDFTAESSTEIDTYVKAHNGRILWCGNSRP